MYVLVLVAAVLVGQASGPPAPRPPLPVVEQHACAVDRLPSGTPVFRHLFRLRNVHDVPLVAWGFTARGLEPGDTTGWLQDRQLSPAIHVKPGEAVDDSWLSPVSACAFEPRLDVAAYADGNAVGTAERLADFHESRRARALGLEAIVSLLETTSVLETGVRTRTELDGALRQDGDPLVARSIGDVLAILAQSENGRLLFGYPPPDGFRLSKGMLIDILKPVLQAMQAAEDSKR